MSSSKIREAQAKLDALRARRAGANDNTPRSLGAPYAPHGRAGHRICPICERQVRDYPAHYAAEHADHAAAEVAAAAERHARIVAEKPPTLAAIQAAMTEAGIRTKYAPAAGASEFRKKALPERVLFLWTGLGFAAWVQLEDDGPALYTTDQLPLVAGAEPILDQVEAIIARKGLRTAP